MGGFSIDPAVEWKNRNIYEVLMPLIPEMEDLMTGGNYGPPSPPGQFIDTWFGPSIHATIHGARGCILWIFLSLKFF